MMLMLLTLAAIDTAATLMPLMMPPAMLMMMMPADTPHYAALPYCFLRHYASFADADDDIAAMPMLARLAPCHCRR